MSFLDVRGLSAGYGPITVLRDLRFDVEAGETSVILGANGAGKTTTLRACRASCSGAGRSASAAGKSPPFRPTPSPASGSATCRRGGARSGR